MIRSYVIVLQICYYCCLPKRSDSFMKGERTRIALPGSLQSPTLPGLQALSIVFSVISFVFEESEILPTALTRK